MHRHNIASFAFAIKTLAVSALNNDNSHFAYRCMESLSYLGCNAAKLKSQPTISAVLQSLAQIGRVARHLNIGCFWSRCLIPVEKHAEENMAHIVTWLIQHDNSISDRFYMQDFVEQAYSRLRGIACEVTPQGKFSYALWVKERKDANGNRITHIEREVGMYGYGGQLDYSDFSNLKEYSLNGTGSEGDRFTMHSEPIEIKWDLSDKDESM